MVNKYKIANKVVEVTSIYYEVHEYCADYLTDEPADYSVTTTQADIDFEREKSAREDEGEGIPVRHFSDSYLEELAVYRKIAEKMLDFDTVLFHGEKRHRKIHAYKALEGVFRRTCSHGE